MGTFSNSRKRISNLGRRISNVVSHTDVSDPMSGFFMVTRNYLDEVVRSLSSVGFKVLLDLLAASKGTVRIGEVGYTFRNRKFGESKLTAAVCLEYVELVLDKVIGDWIPVRYAFFGLVGAIGVLAQLVLVFFLLKGLPFMTAQAIGGVLVMVMNYMLNNRLTFRARRLRGWAWVSGLTWFVVACSVGLYCNLTVSDNLHRVGVPYLPSALAGIFVGSVWNYGVSSMVVWRVKRRYRRGAGAYRQTQGGTLATVAGISSTP
jgi:dolichol-phosphate mannosyltransferase